MTVFNALSGVNEKIKNNNVTNFLSNHLHKKIEYTKLQMYGM